MAENIELSVVLPSYLEEENLRLLLPRLREALQTIPLESEIIVVDTVESLDGSHAVAESEGARLVRRTPGNTFGDAVRTGLAEARGRYIAFMDADGSHSPELLPKLVAEIGKHDVVIASRYTEGGYSETNLILKAMSRVLNISYSIVLGLDVKDVSNSFKVYRAALLDGITLHCKNFDVIEELLFKIQRRHPSVRIKEVPCTFKKRMFGETKRSLLLFMLTYLVTIIRLRFSR